MLSFIEFYPLLMKLLLGIILSLFLINLKTFSNIFKHINKRVWLLLFIIFLCGLLVRLFVIPHTHQVYFDEFDHYNIAQNILYSGRFCECYYGSDNDCKICSFLPWPPGYNTFLSLVLGLFGDSEQVAFNTNAVIGSISIILFFLLLYLSFRKAELALIGAFIFSIIPVHLKYSGSSSSEIFSIFFILLCLIFLEIYLLSKKFSLFLLFTSSLLYAVQTRPENFLLILILSFYILLRMGREVKIFFETKYLIVFYIFLTMLLPLAYTIHYGSAVFHHSGWDDSIPTKIGYLKSYFVPNILFFVDYNFSLILLPFFCFFGAIKLYMKDKKLLAYLFMFLLLFLLMYSSYHIGRIPLGDSVRYSLVLYIPLIIISVKGIESVLNIKKFNKKILVLSIIFLFLIALLPTNSFIFSKSKYESEYNLILSMKNEIPSDVYVISYNTPAIISTIHKKSITPSLFLESMNSSDFRNSVILFKDYWWYERINETVQIENRIKEKYSFQLIRSSGEYAFYNLTKIN